MINGASSDLAPCEVEEEGGSVEINVPPDTPQEGSDAVLL